MSSARSTRGLVGNIYLGKVVRVLPGMQSAFIDIGLERAAFPARGRYLAPARPPTRTAHGAACRSRRTLFEGQALMVQVIKDPIGTKGARLSTQISIAGRTLVYLPQDPHIGISQRIEGEVDREALRARVQGAGAARRAWRLYRAHHRRGSQRRGTRQRYRLPAQDLGVDSPERDHRSRLPACCTRT